MVTFPCIFEYLRRIVMSLKTLVASGIKLTPMMDQYWSIKKNYPETILFFRMGDFYEVFFEDARRTSQLLNITLTQRGKIGLTPIPMAGIPHHAASTYIDRLTGLGLKVAIAEQTESPKDAVGIVKRAVTSIVSPGMPFDLEKTNSEQRFMASGCFAGEYFYLIVIDFTTGEFSGHKLKSIEEFVEKLRLYAPREFILAMGQWQPYKLLSDYLEHAEILKTHLSEEYFNPKYTGIYIEKLIPTYQQDKIIKMEEAILAPIGALAYYISSTQSLENFVHIRPFKMLGENGRLKITLPTLTGLEIFPKTRAKYKESLLGFFDKTLTAMGARKLKKFMQNPLADLKKIKRRQELIQFFISAEDILNKTRENLSQIRDLERILAKVTTNKVTAGDLINLSAAIKAYQHIEKRLNKIPSTTLQRFSKKQIEIFNTLVNKIDQTINDEVGASLDKGNLIKSGACAKRDKLATMNCNANDELITLEANYQKQTGITKLKVKSNNIAGYFIEISKIHSAKVPKNFERKQTLVNTERYITKELAEFERTVLAAHEKLEKLEREIFKDVVTLVASQSTLILDLADKISFIDVIQSFSWCTLQEGLTRPKLSEHKKIVDIKGAWHPLIKGVLKDQFICHNIKLDEQQFFGLITGPNMAGKTTVMREVAIIQLLAQIGCYVPATSAHLGICDYLFSRLGASDDILRGQSTFMVEMSETAEIVRHASERSLIILDEIGRGTSTYDGLSIAWALVEHFVNNTKALGLFATHYHELIELVEKLPAAKNLTVETKNKNGEVQFLYNLIEQGASQSFGIYVAKLAGLPAPLIKRSKEILHDLESEKITHTTSAKTANKKGCNTQLNLFEIVDEPAIPKHLLELESEIRKINIMETTPLNALQKLNQFKELLPFH